MRTLPKEKGEIIGLLAAICFACVLAYSMLGKFHVFLQRVGV